MQFRLVQHIIILSRRQFQIMACAVCTVLEQLYVNHGMVAEQCVFACGPFDALQQVLRNLLFVRLYIKGSEIAECCFGKRFTILLVGKVEGSRVQPHGTFQVFLAVGRGGHVKRGFRLFTKAVGYLKILSGLLEVVVGAYVVHLLVVYVADALVEQSFAVRVLSAFQLLLNLQEDAQGSGFIAGVDQQAVRDVKAGKRLAFMASGQRQEHTYNRYNKAFHAVNVVIKDILYK